MAQRVTGMTVGGNIQEGNLMRPLPIDTIPGTIPRKFKWHQNVSGTVIEHKGMLPPTVEYAVECLINAMKQLLKDYEALKVERDKLQKFKEWVHGYLDAQGVPAEFPDGPHTKEGCRIGDRMDWLMNELKAAQARVESLAERVGKQSDLLSKKAEKPKR
jgi:hypothetical protein